MTLSFRRSNPLIDFRSHGLREGIVDDEIVASVLEFKAEHEGSPVLIVTSDIGIQVLAPGHDLETVAPPEECRLPEEPDAGQAEERKLRAELAEIQGRQSDPVVVFRDGSSRASVILPVVEQVSDSAVKRAVEEAEWASEHERPVLLGDEDDDAGFGYTREQALEYAMRRSNAVHEYMLSLRAARNLRGRTIPLTLRLENRGKALATDIDVEFEISDGDAAFSDSEGADPKDPFAEERGREPWQQDVAPVARSLEATEEVGAAHLTARMVRYQYATLKPSHSVRLAPIFVTFPAREQVRSFALTYKLSHAEGSGATSGRLDVVVTADLG